MARRKRKKKIKPIGIFIAFILIGGLSFGAYKFLNSNETENDTNYNTPNNKNDKNDKKKPDPPKVKIVDENSKSRPYAVMINNLSAARPYHTGLQDAYLVYEIVVEGGITRYLALYKDKFPETVGSVRSARHYYLDYVMENDAYYVHWGWSPQAQSDIKTLNIDNLNGLSNSTPYFFRQKISNVSSEHTGFANLNEMQKLVNTKKYRTTTTKSLLLNYSATEIDLPDSEETTTATTLSLKYSNSFTTNYEYDSESKNYKQSVNNKAHTDYETKQKYTVKNIITYKIANKTISGDDKGRQDLNNIGKGEGYFITGGKAIPITWEKTSRSSQTIYKYKDGTEIKVNDGNTWIHIVPTSGDISIS